MNLILFSTRRQIREYLKNFNNTILDKTKTIGEFLKSIVVVKDKTLIDEDLRKIYFFEAVKHIDISKLGFNKEFLSIAKNSEFIFSFLNELFLERVDIDDVIMNDVYVEFEEHLNLIKHIRDEYKKLLEKDGFYDWFLIEDYEINEGLLENIDKIEINLDGYLSKFDIEVLKKIKIPIIVNVKVTKFNKPLIAKFLAELEEGFFYKMDFTSKEIIEKTKYKNNPNIKTYAFSNRFNEINFVFAKIAEMVNNGINPEKIALILPDESFWEKFYELDEYNNLNFAMGISFTSSPLYKKLKSIYEYKINNDLISFEKIKDIIDEYEKKDLLEFIMDQAKEKEKALIEEEIYRLGIFKEHIKEKERFLHFILERFSKLSFDDTNGGKITCSGVLESRGMDYEGVIIVDFNEGIVPNVNMKDLFLNTFIRIRSNLPTREDKENLQKHYYCSLFSGAKEVAIAYVKNEENTPSRFLYELNLKEAEIYDEKYSQVLFKTSSKKEIPTYNETFQIKEPITPTSLKMLLECPKKYYFSKILDIKNEEEGEVFFGSVLHEALEYALKNKKRINSSDEYFEMIMNYIYLKFPSKKERFDIRVGYEEGIFDFCKKDFEDMKYSENFLLEEWINFKFEGRLLSAKIDRADMLNNKIIMIDYKTSKEVDKEIYDFQMTFYYLWAKEKFKDKNIEVVFYKINDKAEKITANIKTQELKTVLNNLPTQAREAKDIIVNDKIIKKAFDICKYCEYKRACMKE